MVRVEVERDVNLWLTDDMPARMVYAGRRWRVTDTPTRLRESVWSVSAGAAAAMYGWRFQAADEAGEVLVFDVFRTDDSWHVHHAYA